MKQKFKDKNKFDELREIEQRVMKGELAGAVVLDIDGTATVPGKKEEIQPEIIPINAEFVSRGGHLIIPTNRPRAWVEEKLLNPIVNDIRRTQSGENLKDALKRISLSPEQGSAGLVLDGFTEDETGVKFNWNKLWEYNLPSKDDVTRLLREQVMPHFEGSSIRPETEYVVTLEKLKNPDDAESLVERLKTEHSEISWGDINIVKTRSTLNFTHKSAKKDDAVSAILARIDIRDAPVIGFGDLHDEFAVIVQTVNVSTIDPNVFRRHGLATMELQRWIPLQKGQYTTENEGTKDEIVRVNDNEILVVRGKDNKVLRDITGNPVKLEPMIVEGKPLEGAGVGTAWFLRNLIEKGYFKK